VSRHGHAFIDRALYLPKGWTDNPARLKATYVPGDTGFSTKPQLAAEMIERALAAGVPFRWVAADSVYGVGDIERDLRQAGKGYVLGVNSNHWFASWGKPQRVVGTAEEIAKTQRRSDWRRLSAGAGTKGPRLHDWCYLELADLEGEESNHHSQVLWTRGLLIRRNIANGDSPTSPPGVRQGPRRTACVSAVLDSRSTRQPRLRAGRDEKMLSAEPKDRPKEEDRMPSN
jgi:SRSO17 transposase